MPLASGRKTWRVDAWRFVIKYVVLDLAGRIFCEVVDLSARNHFAVGGLVILLAAGFSLVEEDS